eukprot:9514160-Alexandrium_andersonii.AAC.1
MKVAYPDTLLSSVPDGHAMLCSVFALTIGKVQDMGNIEYGRVYDICLPPRASASLTARPTA